MKFRTIVVYLLLIVFCFVGCGKKERIEGVVQDAFGNPLKDVSVKIEKTTFTSNTDGSGKYSIDYAPGSVKLIFSKEGYTTINLDLSIQQKSHFPAETIVLYPNPKEAGFYILTNEVIKLPPEPVRKLTSRDNSQMKSDSIYYKIGDDRTKYMIDSNKEKYPKVKEGNLKFIKTAKDTYYLLKVSDDGVLADHTTGFYGPSKQHYINSIKSGIDVKKVGDPSLTVITVQSTKGCFAFCQTIKSSWDSAIIVDGPNCFPFVVD
jgi:hypothetical protein